MSLESQIIFRFFSLIDMNKVPWSERCRKCWFWPLRFSTAEFRPLSNLSVLFQDLPAGRYLVMSIHYNLGREEVVLDRRDGKPDNQNPYNAQDSLNPQRIMAPQMLIASWVEDHDLFLCGRLGHPSFTGAIPYDSPHAWRVRQSYIGTNSMPCWVLMSFWGFQACPGAPVLQLTLGLAFRL